MVNKYIRDIYIGRLVDAGAHRALDLKEKDIKYYLKDVLFNLFSRYSNDELIDEIKILDEIDEENRLD
jgi:hypothetical protein